MKISTSVLAITFAVLVGCCSALHAKTVEYELTIEHQGMEKGGMMMEGSEETLYEDGREMVVDGMNPKRPLPPYPKLKALHSTAPDPSKPVREIRLTLDGDMDRYVWLLNNKALNESDQIHIKEGEIVRFIMINRTMMYHPMHLHGRFFRIINGQGDRSPLKHTVTVMPMATTVFEFEANEVGDWFFHCHLLYHMHSGMARVVEYDNFTPAPETAVIRDELFKVDPYLNTFSRRTFRSLEIITRSSVPVGA